MSLLPTIAGSRLALLIAQLLQSQHNNGIGRRLSVYSHVAFQRL